MPINILGKGDHAWQGRALGGAADMRGPQSYRRSPTPGMYPQIPQPFGDAPMPYNNYNTNQGPGPGYHVGRGAPPALFPSISGAAPSHLYTNHENQNGVYNSYESKKGAYAVFDPKNGGYQVGGISDAAPEAFIPPARFDNSVYTANGLGAQNSRGYGGAAPVSVADDARVRGMPGGAGAGAGAGAAALGGRGGVPPAVRVLSDALCACLSLSPADGDAALTGDRQPLVRRFLAEGVLPTGADRGGEIADKFLRILGEKLPHALASLHTAGRGGEPAAAWEHEVSQVLTAIHWGLLSRIISVALRSCRLLTSVADGMQQQQQQQHASSRWGGNDSAASSRVSRLLWGWLSARVSPPVGGAIAAALMMLRQHGMAGGGASGDVSAAVASFMYEFSGRGHGLRQLLAIEIPARAGAGRSGGLLLLAKVVDGMAASVTTGGGLGGRVRQLFALGRCRG